MGIWFRNFSLLYFEGYEDKNHYSLIVALESLFGGKGKLSRSSLGYLKESQRLREKAERDLEYSQESAENILSAAEQFIGETETILGS